MSSPSNTAVPASLYRKSCLHELAKLYHNCGRNQEALDLLYGLVERERKAGRVP